MNSADSRFCNNCALALPKPHNRAGTWLLMGLVSLYVGGFLVAVLLFGNQPATTQTTQSTPAPVVSHWDSTTGKIEAFVMSQTFVSRRLKSPGSAQFPSYPEIAVSHDGGGIFTVDGYVDSQNSFGAKLRTRYHCQLKDDGDQSWSLLSLTIR